MQLFRLSFVCIAVWGFAGAGLVRGGDAVPSDAAPSNPTPTDARLVNFALDIAPVFVQHCASCHGSKNPAGEYRVDTVAGLLKAGASTMEPIVAAKPDESELLRLLESEDPEERMPKDADPLPAETIALVRSWIVQGAKIDPEHLEKPLVSILPRSEHPDPPEAYPLPVPIGAIAFSPDGNELAVAGYHEVTVWNATDGTLLRRLKNLAQRTYALSYSPDGALLAVAGGTPGRLGEVVVVDPATGELKHTFGPYADVVLDTAFSPDGQKLASAGADRVVRIFSLPDGQEKLTLAVHADWATTVAWNNESSRVVTGGRDKSVKMFELNIDARTSDIVANYPNHDAGILDAVLSPDGQQVYSADSGRRLHAWKTADSAKIGDIRFAGSAHALALHNDQLVAGLSDHSVVIHDRNDRKHLRTLSGHTAPVTALSIHAASDRIASADASGQLRTWKLSDGTLLETFLALPGLTLSQSD